MACYIVTFEVANVVTKNALKEKLKAYGFQCPIHGNAWAVVTTQTAAQVRDALMPGLAATDSLFVVRSGTEAAWINTYGQQHTDWLKKYL